MNRVQHPDLLSQRTCGAKQIKVISLTTDTQINFKLIKDSLCTEGFVQAGRYDVPRLLSPVQVATLTAIISIL